jgi:hypothetical protein
VKPWQPAYLPPELRRFQLLRRFRCRAGHKWRRYDPTTFRCDRCGGFQLGRPSNDATPESPGATRDSSNAPVGPVDPGTA